MVHDNHFSISQGTKRIKSLHSLQKFGWIIAFRNWWRGVTTVLFLVWLNSCRCSDYVGIINNFFERSGLTLKTVVQADCFLETKGVLLRKLLWLANDHWLVAAKWIDSYIIAIDESRAVAINYVSQVFWSRRMAFDIYYFFVSLFVGFAAFISEHVLDSLLSCGNRSTPHREGVSLARVVTGVREDSIVVSGTRLDVCNRFFGVTRNWSY